MTLQAKAVALLTILVLAAGLVQRPAMAAGDPVRGKQLSVPCFGCHGVNGSSPSPVNPRIGGQHEQYLFNTLKEYQLGTRRSSLMRGAVLDKSEQDLMDIAAYYAGQTSGLVSERSPSADASASAQAPRGAPAVVRFDHGAHTAKFNSLSARARAALAARQPLADNVCEGLDVEVASRNDADGDGLDDAFDAAPNDAAEFVADKNADGFFELCNAPQLAAISGVEEPNGGSLQLDMAKRLQRSYQLARDIDAGGLDAFEPIGSCGPTGNCMRALGAFGYAGVFDGRGFVLSNLELSHPERGGVGLFGVLSETGLVIDLVLVGARVSGRAGTGAVVGSNFGGLYRLQATGNVQADMAVGGLVGGSAGLVLESRFTGAVIGKQAVGGLVGDMTGAVFNSISMATVTGTRGTGGLVGLNTFGYVLGSSAAGPVVGVNDTGGLVGVSTDGRIRNSYATGNVIATGSNAGGIAGFNSLSTIRNSFALGKVTGDSAVGGIVGRNNGEVVNAFAGGSAAGESETGVAVGVNVDGSVNGVYPIQGQPAALNELSGESTGWAPRELPATGLLDYFCDLNGNGFIDPGEVRTDNYVWKFGAAKTPILRCAALDASI